MAAPIITATIYPKAAVLTAVDEPVFTAIATNTRNVVTPIPSSQYPTFLESFREFLFVILPPHYFLFFRQAVVGLSGSGGLAKFLDFPSFRQYRVQYMAGEFSYQPGDGRIWVRCS